MLSDITIGQYFPGKSIIHKFDPRGKIVLVFAFLIFIFCAGNFYSLGFCALSVLFFIIVSQVPIKVYLKNIKVIVPILAFTAIINLFYIREGTPLLQFWVITVTSTGISRSVFMILRVVLLIMVSSVLTYTTTPNDLTDAIERLLSPLKFIGLGRAVHVMTMMMTIALRFIPTLIEETGKIMNAQKARGADFENGKLKEKILSVVTILIPLLISSVRRAYELAEAMESRCYNGGVGKQRMKQLKYKTSDYVGTVAVLSISVIIFLLNRF